MWRTRKESVFPALRRLVLLVVIALATTYSGRSEAEDVAVPVALQAELLAKLAGYDKNFAARAGVKAHVVLLAKAQDVASRSTAAQFQAALARVDRIGGVPHDEQIVIYSGSAELASMVRSRGISIVYIAPGFTDDIDAIKKALDGVDVLTVTAVASYVPPGIVLGFDLVSSKPKLLVNLPQARRQNVALRAEVLKMMRVYE